MATRKRALNKAARIRALLAKGYSTERIVAEVKGAKQKDVYNVTYRLRRQELEAKAGAKPKAAAPTRAETFNEVLAERQSRAAGEQAMTATQWLDSLRGEANEALPVVGVEITVRLVMEDPDDFNFVEEVMEKARENGTAEITRQVALRREG